MKLLCLASAMAFGLTGCGDKSPLDPGNPVSLTIWHYYNGSQQAAFDSLVEEFNDTVGREKGIYIQSYSQGSVSDLESAVRDSVAGKVGAEKMPDIFSSETESISLKASSLPGRLRMVSSRILVSKATLIPIAPL